MYTHGKQIFFFLHFLFNRKKYLHIEFTHLNVLGTTYILEFNTENVSEAGTVVLKQTFETAVCN